MTLDIPELTSDTQLTSESLQLKPLNFDCWLTKIFQRAKPESALAQFNYLASISIIFQHIFHVLLSRF